MLSTKGVNVVEKSFESKYLTYGVQQAMVVSAEVREFGGKKDVLFHMESPEVKSAGFEPDTAAKRGGKVGRVKFVRNINEKDPNDIGLKDFLEKVSILATKLGVIDAVNAIQAPDIDSYVDQLIPIIRGKFAWFAVTGSEYLNKSDKIGISLGLRRYGFVASLEEGEEHLRPFNKANTYDFKPYAVPSKDGEAAPDPISEAFGDVDPNMPKGDDLPW